MPSICCYLYNFFFLGSTCSPECPPYRHVNVQDVELFLPVDISILPKLKLHVHTAHKMFNVTRYKIQLNRSLVVNGEWNVVTEYVNVLPNQTHFTFIYNTNYKPGIYNFSVTPIHGSCSNKHECKVSKAPGIVIGTCGMLCFKCFELYLFITSVSQIYTGA